jgi:hypothetical protein
MENLYVFCDESGNTGINIIDPQQPILVVGGWIVPVTRLNEANKLVKKVNIYSNELHGIDLLKGINGQKLIKTLIHELCKLNCFPVSVIAEKRYILSGTLLDTFLDPGSNPKSPRDYDFDAVGKPEVVDIIYELPDRILHEFFEAYCTLDRQLLLDSLRSVHTALSLRLHTDLADMMIGCLPNIDNLIKDTQNDRSRMPAKTMIAPNSSAFFRFFQYLEELGRMGNSKKVSIIHDNNEEFKEAFNTILAVFRDSKKSVVHLAQWKNLYYGFESVKGLRFADSKDEPLLQAADIVVSSIQRYVLGVYKHQEIPVQIQEIASSLLPRPHGYPRIAMLIVSKELDDQLSRF